MKQHWMKFGLALVALGIWTTVSLSAAEPAATLTVQADQPGPKISPTLWGVFFEDINFAGDGGLYAELVKNRSFEFAEPLMGWQHIDRGGKGSLTVLDQNPLNPNNPHFLRLKVETATGGLGLANEGFRGIGVRKGAQYDFSVYARTAAGGSPSLRVELVTADGKVLGSQKVTGFTREWQKITGVLRASATQPKARLNVIAEGRGTLDLDMVSLFPHDTWKHRPNGLRADLVQRLKDLQPGFVRFPGGCIVEGRDLATRYQWKNTIGDVAQRQTIINRWNTEFAHRPTPDYFQSFGLGFFEYFLLCEDIGAEPLPILNCGMACQFNTGQLVPLNELNPYVQDALDLIQFANGPTTSPWGAKRAAMGHPRPFNLKLLGVGNEQWGPQYFERYEKFARELKARHPEITLVSGAGPSPADDRFQSAWSKLRELKADVVDEHCYDNPEWFFTSATRYDKYDRHGPKVFMGEYAAQSVKTCSPDNRNNLECALSEAAFMTGLERNADVVIFSSYAPLFAHEEGWQWRPDLIWYDNLTSYVTPNYYVQQLFSRNRGDVVAPVQIDGMTSSSNSKTRLYATACRDQKAGEIIVKVVNPAATPMETAVKLQGVLRVAPQATAITLAGDNLTDDNSLAEPVKVTPKTTTVANVGPEFHFTFGPQSLTVLRLKVK